MQPTSANMHFSVTAPQVFRKQSCCMLVAQHCMAQDNGSAHAPRLMPYPCHACCSAAASKALCCIAGLKTEHAARLAAVRQASATWTRAEPSQASHELPSGQHLTSGIHRHNADLQIEHPMLALSPLVAVCTSRHILSFF